MSNFYQHAVAESKKYNTVVIFGAGSSAFYLYKKLKEAEIRVEAFLVSDTSKNKSYIDGIPVVQVDETQVNKEKTLVLIGMSKASNQEITAILCRNGFQHYLEPIADMAWGEFESVRRVKPAIEITTQIGCSVNCRYCPQEVLLSRYFAKNKNRKRILTLEDYKRCLHNLPDDAVITFSGFCEPFLNPECSDMICYTVKHGNKVSLHTTLVGMTMKDFDKISHLPFENVVLHTPDKHKYANIPVTENYLQVLDNMLNARDQNGESLIRIANCQSEPDEEILNIINHRVSFSSTKLVDRAGNIKEEEVAENVKHEGKIACVQSSKLQRNVLLPDGTLVLCCMDFGLEHEIGNLLYDSYDEIVKGEIVQGIKDNMENGGNVLCRKCSMAKCV